MINLRNGWTKTNEDPYYFIKRMDDIKNSYRGISLFSVDDGICAEKHFIDYMDIPNDTIDEYKNDVKLTGEEFRKFIVECAFTEGYGRTFDKRFFEWDEFDDLNEYLKEEGIALRFTKQDFI